MATAYRRARRDASVETDLDPHLFPHTCPWSYEQAMQEDFWPEA
jgi:hypothetical protein